MRLDTLLLAITCFFSSTSAALAAPQDALRDKQEVVVSAWLPGWLEDYDLDLIDWKAYTHLTYAFAVTTDDEAMISLDLFNTTLLEEFVARAKKEGVIPGLSIGGWAGSRYFSKHVQPTHQDAFIEKIIGMVNKYQVDSIDFDWEYPNNLGIGCNLKLPDDTKNLLSLLKKLRAHPVGLKLILTAAVAVTPFAAEDGSPSSDVSEFAAVLDRIAIMNYDIWNVLSSVVGPSAPLCDSCAPSGYRNGSASSAVKAWTEAGFPARKIVLGVPAYGHSYTVDKALAIDGNGEIVLYQPFNRTIPPGEGEEPGIGKDAECGNPSGPSGIWDFEGLIKAGFLRYNSGEITPAPELIYKFDECSQTPFLYNLVTQVMISYDDPCSFALKGKFINDHDLLGFAMWDATGDSSQNALINSIAPIVRGREN